MNLLVSLIADRNCNASSHYSLRRIPRAGYAFAVRLQAVWHVIPAKGKAWLRCKLASSLFVWQIIFAFCHHNVGLICVKSCCCSNCRAFTELVPEQLQWSRSSFSNCACNRGHLRQRTENTSRLLPCRKQIPRKGLPMQKLPPLALRKGSKQRM